jgi:hypothetical protein
MKLIKNMLLVAGVSAILVGCATNDQNAGTAGPIPEIGVGQGESPTYYGPPRRIGQLPMGPNGSIGAGNPFGGTSLGLGRAYGYPEPK